MQSALLVVSGLRQSVSTHSMPETTPRVATRHAFSRSRALRLRIARGHRKGQYRVHSSVIKIPLLVRQCRAAGAEAVMSGLAALCLGRVVHLVASVSVRRSFFVVTLTLALTFVSVKPT